MHFQSIPLLNLARRPMRSGLTIIGVAVAVASFIALVGLTRGLEKAWVSTFLDRGTHLIGMKKGAVEILTASIPEEAAEKLRNTEGIREVAGELTDLVTVASGQVAIMSGWQNGSFLWQTLRMQNGRIPVEGADEVAIGHGLSQALQVAPGDSITVNGYALKVVGVFRQSSVMTNGTAIVLLKDMQKMMQRQNSVTVFNLMVFDPQNSKKLDEIKTLLREKFDQITFVETSEVAENNEILKLFGAMAWGTSIVALLIAIVVIVNTLLMTVAERTREIGILSALGWSSFRIIGMILSEGFILAIFGAFSGAALGVYGLHLLSNVAPLKGFLQPEISFRLIVEVCGATLLLGMAGGLYPAFRAVSVDPISALRHE